MPFALFSKSTAPSKVSIKSRHVPAQAEPVRSRQQVVSLLHRMGESHNLMTVELPDCGNDFSSAIIKLDTRNNRLCLDALNPDEGNALLAESRLCYVSSHLRGVFVGFAARVTNVVAGRAPLYEVAIPDSLDYFQRRRHFRANVPAAVTMTIYLLTDDNRRITGSVRDLSQSGACAWISQEIPDNVQRGTIFPRCSIDLPDRQKLIGKFQITHLQRSHRNRSVRIGGRFLDLEPVHVTTLQKIVAEFDRTMLKSAIRS